VVITVPIVLAACAVSGWLIKRRKSEDVTFKGIDDDPGFASAASMPHSYGNYELKDRHDSSPVSSPRHNSGQAQQGTSGGEAQPETKVRRHSEGPLLSI